MSWIDFCQGREKRENISRYLENEMLVRKCYIISTPCVYSVAASIRSEIWVVHRQHFLIHETVNYQGWQPMKLFFFWVCYVIRALETGWPLKYYFNLISIHTRDWFKRITECAVQISWGILSNMGNRISEKLWDRIPLWGRTVELVSMKLFPDDIN